ncbi:translation initiation factor IF-2 [Firmicutes bacterium CAG:534]|nr:translation initiation factor IF-2 [Firmicutes bacterium CAG:534]
MAKIKVHEIAKELEKQSKEIIAFLQDKGIEVKAAQSSIEDDVAAMVRKAFGGSKADTETAKEKEAAPVTAEKQEETKKAEPEKAPEKPEAPAQGTSEPPKKKKKIIFVSNPHNSNFSSQQRPQGNNRPMQNQGQRPGGNRQGQGRAQEAPHKIIRPLTAPSVMESTRVDFRENARKLENERIAAKNNQAREKEAERQAQENNQQQKPQAATTENTANQNARPAAGDRRPARPAGRDDRYQRNERSSQGSYNNQGERNNRNDSRRPEGGSRAGAQNGRNDFRNNNGERNYNRPGNNQGRSERGPQGQDNRFKRAEKPGKGFTAETPVKDEKRRDEEKRRISQEKDKRSKKDFMYEEDEAAAKSKNKAGRFIKPEKKVEDKVEEQIKVITIPETLTIKELADKMKLQPSVIIKKLFLQGQIVTVNSEISFEDAENIAIDYEIICEKEQKVDVIEELLKEDEDAEETLVSRPPVICVMGHVDHGKTSLLDAIRKTNVTDKEAGGITQHIGAYTVNVNGQSITFLDTPGHEAFTAMRMRGANSTDIAILVVAADDGVMPQTVEAINHAKAAGIEIIVAVNKIDKPGANVDRVKQEMTEYELIPVDWGGTTEFVPVSAKSGEGIENLLETILLTAEILELKANPNRRARGLVIEAELDKGRGPVATVLVQKGTLHVGDFISAGASHGKVRAMIDDKGRRVKEALPSTPVEILGLSDVPSAGEVFIAHENDKTAKNYAETYLAQNKEKMLEETKAKMSLDDLFTQIQAGNLKELNIIVKADVQGSVEAVKQSLMKLSNEEVVVKCIHGGVGAINESDVSLASASAAIIIGFNVRPDAMAKAIAEREGVDIRLYRVIYQAIEDIEAAMKGMLDPVYEEKVIGHAEVRQIFRASAVGNIAGSYVLDGYFQRDCKVRITREGEQIYEGALASLKRFKDDVKEVKAGFECGLVFEGFDQMQELDIVEAYIMVEVPR